MERKNADSLVGLPSSSARVYNAAGTNSLYSVIHGEWCGYHSLFVRGFILDTVEIVSVASQNGNIPEEWLKIAGWTDTESNVPDAF